MADVASPPAQKVISLCVDPAASKHLLQLATGRSFVSRPFGDPGDGVDIVLFQASQSLDFVDRAVAAPDAMWRNAREGRGKVVFDASAEGEPHDPELTLRLHALLDRVRVPLDRAVYVTQDRQYAADYAHYCAGLGVARRMTVAVYDYWVRRLVSAYEESGAEVLARRREIFERRSGQRSRRFLSLNFTPRPERVLYLLSLMQQGLWDFGHVSFGGFDRKDGRKSMQKVRKRLRSLPGFEDMAEALIHLLPELEARRNLFAHGDREDHAPSVRPLALEQYDDSWFSVVTETEMLDRPCRITEKPLKPILNFHPFLMFGNPGALAIIRELGFVTFPELFDESYDDECNPRRRFEMAFEELQRLCRMDERDLARVASAVSEKAAFNAEWAMTRLPLIYRDKIDEKLIQALVG